MTGKLPHETVHRARLEPLWDEVLTRPQGERQRFVDGIQDGAIRKELASLLADAARAESFFARLEPMLYNIAQAAAQESARDTVAEAQTEEGLADPLLGQSVGHYRIDSRLGQGGMGVVYRALDTRLQRTVALKFLPPHLSSDARARERFLIEARSAAALDHPNICNIHEIGGDDHGPPFIAMAFYAGETLAQALLRGPLAIAQALDYALQIARGLSAAHDRRIIHRDAKPGNVLITADGVVKLLDFGIARMRDVTVSLPGLTPGTTAYMSPEQVTARGVDERTDLWSLGVVLYEMCTGVGPFHRNDQGATLHAILHEHPAPPATGQVIPGHVYAIIDRLLQKDPGDRYANVNELIDSLESALAGEIPDDRGVRGATGRRVRRRRMVRATGVVAALIAAAWLVWGLAQQAEPTRILVADAAGDTASGNLVSERLRERLASPRVRVAGRPSLDEALQRMGRDPSVRLSPAIARELAVREGLKAFVHVTVDRIGNAFLIGGILVAAETGDLIDHRQATALNAAELIPATDRLADGIRRTLGRSLVSIRGTRPLLALTTDSLSALRRHLEAVQANRNGDFRGGVQIEEETIAIDPNLADAHQTLGFALEQIGERAGRAQTAFMNANVLRPRLTPHERFSVEADYFWQVEGDLRKAEMALRNSHSAIEELQPGRVLNRRSWGLVLMLTGNLGEAERVLQAGRAFAACPVTKSQLTTVLYALKREDVAREVLHEAVDQWPTNPLLGMDQAHFHAVEGDYRTAHDAVTRLHGGYTLPFALRSKAVFDAVEGRLREAIDHLDDLRRDHLTHSSLAPALEVTAAIARLRLVAGDTLDARKRVNDFLRQHPLTALDPAGRPYLSLALFFADARDPDRARQLLAEYDTLVPARFKGPDRWMQQRVRASLLMALDSAPLALDELLEARHTDRVWSNWLDNPLFGADERPELARAYDRLGQPDSAIAVFERYLNKRVLYRAEMDAFHRAHALQRLAELYEQRNQWAQAQSKRDELAKLWQTADPELKLP